MKKYRTYTAKKYKIVRKIIFFAIVAVAIFGATVIWGNILKNKIENTEVPPPLDVETTAPEENKDEQKGEAGVSHDEALSKVKAGCLDLSLMTDIQSARGAVDALKAGGYNCVSFNVTDKEGKLTYASPGVVQDSRLPAKETLISYEVLKATSEYAKGLSMRLSCVIVASESFSSSSLNEE